MEFTAGQIAEMLGGQVQGDASCTVNQLAKLEEGTEGAISFLSNPKYEPYIYTTKASIIIVDKTFQPKKTLNSTLVLVDNPYVAFSSLLTEYKKLVENAKIGIELNSFIGQGTIYGENIYLGSFAYIGKNCKIGNNVKIWPQVFVGDNVEIGDNTDIQPGVKIYSNTKIGKNCVFKANSVIGSEGFGFALQENGTYKNIPQLGNVIIEDNVNIGANTTVDCSTLGSTIIHSGVKIDNLVQVAHNVELGENTILVAQSGVAGSTKIGDNCVIGGQAAVVGHIVLANGTKVGGQSGVTKSVKKEGIAVNGTPAFEYADNLKAAAIFKHLPELEKRVKQIEIEQKNLVKE
jgi:UDP-3-O-[3-hydroxymyristoyl] glucosamine N-acyltransferase